MSVTISLLAETAVINVKPRLLLILRTTRHAAETSDSKHTCFTHWAGDLTTAEVCPQLTSLGRKELKIKDAAMKDFTMDKPTDSFKIRYPNHGGVSLKYWNFDPNTGCKDILIKGGDNDIWRIWVSDEDGNDRDIDTLNTQFDYKTFCSKWIHIHIKKRVWD
ncbi:related to Mig1 protein, induced during biotrophic phase [Ustilago sp. UG-2017b]|nr:related to Mig1 protein, induced during biotrophic phase [Ustilago sp. UG-2017b]